jgi:AcrR family transcriptional regulator
MMISTHPLSEHRQNKYDRMIQKILDTARSIMQDQGVAALSMNELARRLDMRPPSLYHYFSGKMDLYDALFRVGFRLFAGEMEKIAQEAGTWQEYVKNSFSGYLSFAKHNPDLYQLCFERPVPGFVPSAESLQLSLETLQNSYRYAGEMKKTIRTDLSAQQIVDLLIAVMHGITAMHMSNEPDLPADQGRFGPLIPLVLDLLEKAWA